MNKEIKSIEFGLLSSDDILKMSVVEVNNSKMDEHKNNTLYDALMGPINSKDICIVCEMSSKDCPGHFAHINLNIEVIHPMYYKYVLMFLKCVCINCSRLLVSKEHLELMNIKHTGESRFKIILEECVKTHFCIHCNISQPKHSVQDGVYTIVYKSNKSIEKVKLTVNDIKNIFQRVSNEDVDLLGISSDKIHPRNFVLKTLPVLPHRSRPFIVAENNICDDDLTITLNDIVKINNSLNDENISESRRNKNIQTLIFRIKTLYDNSAGKAKHTNKRPLKGIKERLSGKEGLIRNNMMGKRVNYSGRTVVGPDPTLNVDEIIIPIEMANDLSVPVHVNRHNMDILQTMVWNGDVNFIEKITDGKTSTIHMKYAFKGKCKQEYCTIKIGDIVHRKLKDGDIVFLNRQPTLHKGSMLAKYIKVYPGKTIRMNLATTGTFNADFDGDEMNIFVPQSVMSATELECLSATKQNIMGVSSSNPIIFIVQDVLLSCYLMTRDNREIPRDVFYQILCRCDPIYINNLEHKLHMTQQIYKKYNKDYPLYCGKTLFSILLPDTFNYHVKNNVDELEPIVKMEKGVLYEGIINKVNLKNTRHSIISYLCKEYSNDVACQFINNVQFMGNEYLLYTGFTIGIKDCIPEETVKEQIEQTIAKSFIEASYYETSIKNSIIKESKINMILSKAKDVGMNISKKALKSDNNFISTVSSGSKGDYFNICQITGLLGQQNITGKRIPCHLNSRKRSLPHFVQDDPVSVYEQRGFITHSFIEGLSPTEFWFHAMSGREGITDTALKTANSGYIQRKIIKTTEDVQVKYDNSVRNSVGSIIQFAYGNDHLCGSKLVHKDEQTMPFDITRLCDKINTNYEVKNNIF